MHLISWEKLCPSQRTPPGHPGEVANITMEDVPSAQISRKCASTGRDKTAKYRELIQSGKYDGLPSVARIDEVEPALREWEAAHPNSCQPELDDGQFFGFHNVAAASLAGPPASSMYLPFARPVTMRLRASAARSWQDSSPTLRNVTQPCMRRTASRSYPNQVGTSVRSFKDTYQTPKSLSGGRISRRQK